MPDRNDGIKTESAWVKESGPHGEMWFKNKTPFILSEVDYKPPSKKSKDVIEVTLDEVWSEMRTEAIGRRVWYYRTWNATKGHEYSCELFLGIRGEPCGVCNCPSAVVCKHLIESIRDLLLREPSFGERELDRNATLWAVIQEGV